MEDITESIVEKEAVFFVPSYGDLEAHINKYGDVVITQNGQTIIIKRDDYADMENYLMSEWNMFDECAK